MQNEPIATIQSLANRIYSLGETTGRVQDMIDAEKKAGDDVRQYIASGATKGLLSDDPSTMSPLMAASSLGYPNVVAALLTSPRVQDHINDVDKNGETAWITSTLSMRQSIWTCNPQVADNLYASVPLLVTLPYYLANPTHPYQKTRAILEAAGAVSDTKQAKSVWLGICKNQPSGDMAQVQASADMQSTVQQLGISALSTQLATQRKRAEESKKAQ